MKFLRAASDFFFFTSIYIALCAVVMTLSTYGLFNIPVNADLVYFIFSGTLCSYNFHWYLTPDLLSGKRKASWSYSHRYIHLAIFLSALLAATWFAIRLIEEWHWLLLTAFVTFLYSAPKIPLAPFRRLNRIALGKTVFLAFAWTHIPFILPLMVAGFHWTTAAYLLVFNRFYLIYAICILFDYRDREHDRVEGIRSLVTQLPEKGVDRLFIATMAVFFISAAIFYPAGFDLITMIILLLPGVILTVIYRYAKNHRSDYYYYFFLDGLMMLSSLLILITEPPFGSQIK